ncbi:MAG: PKD domain-containing protein [Bacteroidota bacterium]
MTLRVEGIRKIRWYALPILAFLFITAFKTLKLARTNAGHEPVPVADFINFESAHVHPLDMTPDGKKLLAVNTAANTLEVFTLTDNGPVNTASIPVGIDPVSVRIRNNSEAWVANVISDNVSIVDLDQEVVIRTLKTENEPSDIVFAGSPQKAFVSCAERESILIFDLNDLDAAPNEVLLIGEQPRAMAVSPDGNTVYTAFFESGNQTTVINGNQFIAAGGLEAAGSGSTTVPDDVRNPNGPYAGAVPVPNDGTGFNPPLRPGLPPKLNTQSLVVKKNAAGQWLDDNGGNWTNIVNGGAGERVNGWDLKDRDVAVLNANNLNLSYQSTLGNILMAMAVNPSSAKVSVVGTDATNHIRFTPNLNGTFMRVNISQFTPGSSNVDITDLNNHLTYATPSVSNVLKEKSIGDPRGIAWTSNGGFAYVTGMGSNNVIIIDQNGGRALGDPIEVGEGPTGVVVDQNRDQVYVLNKFGASISTVSMSLDIELSQTPFFDPTPTVIKNGRKHLYDTHLGSGNGTISCASCHVDGKWDRLAWDLGDPSGNIETIGGMDFHPLKGLKVTQSLIDIIDKGEGLLHWRGDREAFIEFAGTFNALQGLSAPLDTPGMEAFEDFLSTTYHTPNPYRQTTINEPLKLNGLVRGAGTTFQTFTMDNLTGVNAIGRWHEDCGGCHVNHTGRGLSGSSFGSINYGGNENMSADLRSTYKKLGFYYNSTESTAGFGMMSDGVVDTEFFKGGGNKDGYFVNFHALILGWAGGGPTFSNLGFTAFPHESQDAHFGIGLQASLSSSAGNVTEVDSLLTLVNNPETMTGIQQAAELGLIVKGIYQGEERGFLYQGANSYQSDSANQTLTHAQLISEAQSAGPLTWTIVHKAAAERMAIDRNSNGTYDKEERIIANFSYTRQQPDAIPASFSFDASNSKNPTGNSLSYTWDFGDGNTGTGISPNHTYTQAGTYQVLLSLEDGSQTGTCHSSQQIIQNIEIEPINAFELELMLEGPFVSATGIMDDDLRSEGLLPANDPYSLGANMDTDILNRTGNDAPVDWIKVQLRDKNDPTQVVGEKAFVLQRNGEVINPEGGDFILSFPSLPTDDYYVAVFHINHLAVMTANPIDFTSIPLIDFTQTFTPVYTLGGSPRREINGVMLFWGGDASGNGRIDAIDKNLHWLRENGGAYEYGVTNSDFNLDGNINALDLNLFWRRNNSLTAQLP